jgi:hypothetical protein
MVLQGLGTKQYGKMCRHRQRERNSEKGMGFRRTVRCQPAETQNFTPPATNTILRTLHPKTTEIRRDIPQSKGRIVP